MSNAVIFFTKGICKERGRRERVRERHRKKEGKREREREREKGRKEKGFIRSFGLRDL